MSKPNADVSTPKHLRSFVRGALRAARAFLATLESPRLLARIGFTAFLALQTVACADVTAPGRRLDHDGVESVLPAITDARRRVASGISDVAIRQQLTLTLSGIEIALRGDDVPAVQKGITDVTTMLAQYGPRAYADRPEISAVLLALAGAQRVATPETISVLSP
jgi:hypothetical protein